MYCDFFGLRCRPFEDRADAQFFYATAELEETLAAMEYKARYDRGVSLILGGAGTGKTMLVRTLLPRLSATDHVVVLTWRPNGKDDLIRVNRELCVWCQAGLGHRPRWVSWIQRRFLSCAMCDLRSRMM